MTTGYSKDAGWMAGMRRTLPIGLDAAWALLLSPPGLAAWLAPGVEELCAGETYTGDDGTTGEVRRLRPGDRVRVTWQPPERDTDATLQVVVRPAASGTTVGLHAERLVDERDREELLERFAEIHARLNALTAG